jgi:hypothetical protein
LEEVLNSLVKIWAPGSNTPSLPWLEPLRVRNLDIGYFGNAIPSPNGAKSLAQGVALCNCANENPSPKGAQSIRLSLGTLQILHNNLTDKKYILNPIHISHRNPHYTSLKMQDILL